MSPTHIHQLYPTIMPKICVRANAISSHCSFLNSMNSNEQHTLADQPQLISILATHELFGTNSRKGNVLSWSCHCTSTYSPIFRSLNLHLISKTMFLLNPSDGDASTCDYLLSDCSHSTNWSLHTVELLKTYFC